MFFADYSVKELSALASTLNISGRSKMNKAELFQAISKVIDSAHAEALVANETVDFLSILQGVAEVMAMPVSTEKFRIPRKLKKSLKKHGVL
jgi:hypothetical protein